MIPQKINASMKDICCIGHLTRDKIITPQKTVYMAGGTSFYFAYGINQLPGEVSFELVTKVGDDGMDDVERMRRAGIDVRCFPSAHSVYFENRYGEDPNDRTQRVLAKADPFTLDELKDLEARLFHLGTLLADDFPPSVIEYLATKGRISIDAQGFLREVRGEQVYAVDWADKRRILQLTDILNVNEKEMEVITGLSEPRDVARRLAQWGVREVVVTLGNEGSLIYADDCFHEIPAYQPSAVVDATGCGDTYSTGYLYCRAQGMDIDEAGRFAAAMCTSKLAHSGPFSGSIAEIRQIMRRNPDL